MGTKIIERLEPTIYTFNELEEGVMYRQAEQRYHTFYFRVSDTLVWFENGDDHSGGYKFRIGTATGDKYHDRDYILAPIGTTIVITLEQ